MLEDYDSATVCEKLMKYDGGRPLIQLYNRTLLEHLNKITCK